MHAHTLEIVLLTFEELAQGLDTRLQLFQGRIHVAPLPPRGIVETGSTALHAAVGLLDGADMFVEFTVDALKRG